MATSETCSKCKDNFVVNNKHVTCGCCNAAFHNMCVRIKDQISKAVFDTPNILWFCDVCIGVVNKNVKLFSKIDELADKADILVRQTADCLARMELSQQNAGGLQDSQKPRKNYADALKEAVLIVKPTTKCESKQTKKDLQDCLDRVSLDIGINRVSEAKNGAVIVKCRDKEDANKLKTNLEKNMSQQFSTAIPEKRKPCIKIVGIEREFSEDELIRALQSQNRNIVTPNSEMKLVVTKKMVKTFLAIFECDPGTFARIQKDAEFRLYVGLKVCRCYEYIRVYRCYNCSRFGHSSKDCPHTKTCGRCCSESHESADCSAQKLTCINCQIACKEFKLDLNTEHSTFSLSCPSYKRLEQKERLKIQYEPML